MKTITTTFFRAFIFGMLLLLDATSQAQIGKIDGPSSSCAGKEESYTYSYYPNGAPAFTFQSCTLTVSGGVFVPSNTTQITGTGPFKVRWSTGGFIVAKLFYKVYSSSYVESTNKSVVINDAVSGLGITNLFTQNTLDIHCAYKFGANREAEAYEWSVSGSATLSSNGSKQASIQTTGTAGTATVGLRVFGCGAWSAWVYKTVNVAPTPPSVSISGDNIMGPNTRRTFTASGASTYDWRVTGDISIRSVSGNQITIETYSYFRGSGSVEVRGKDCYSWSNYRVESLRLDCRTASTPTISGTTSPLCPNKSYTFTASADNANEYDWTVIGSYSNIVRDGNKLTLTPSSNFTGGNINVAARYRSYCDWSPHQRRNISRSTCCAPAYGDVLLKEGYNRKYLCFLTDHTIQIVGPVASRYVWRVTGNGYALSPTSTTNNWLDIQTGAGNGTVEGKDVVVYVDAYYCDPPQIVTTSKRFTCDATNCGIGGTRLSLNEDVQAQSIYPNPVKAGENLNLVLSDMAVAQVKVYDKMGKLVKQLPGTLHGTLEIPTTDLASGMYVIQVVGASEVKKFKFSVE